MKLHRGPRRLYDEWRRNYRWRSGLAGLAAGLAGSLRLSLRTSSPQGKATEIRANGDSAYGLDVVTFSVIPGLTRLWVRALLAALPARDIRIHVGDCSGGLRSLASWDERLRIIPIFNHVHGIKLDLFMTRLCRAPRVLVCDDDIFWLNRCPLLWARDALGSGSKRAVVSLYPRGATKPILAGKVEQPMGSFCLVIRRDVWIREKLSFRWQDPSGKGRYEWTYDTADLAHQELLERGYEVTIAPPEIRDELVSLEGVSTWALKLQKHRGDMSRLLRTGLRLRKAYRVFRFLADLPALERSDDRGRGDTGLVAPDLLARAVGWCRSQMPAEEMRKIDREVAGLICRLGERFEAITASAANPE